VCELLLQVILRAEQPGAAVEARTAGDKLPCIFERFCAAELDRGLRVRKGKLQQ
jgi:hypothetical protein